MSMPLQMAMEHAKAMIENGATVAEANIAIVRMAGVRLVTRPLDRATRAALMQGVRDGRIGRLPKGGLKPEAFFHPNALDSAKEARGKAENAGLRAILGACA